MSGSASRPVTLMGFGGVKSVAPVRDKWEEWARWGHQVSVRSRMARVVGPPRLARIRGRPRQKSGSPG